jgi:His-Xaa-Ser system radical SAM maturase HxsC
MLEMSSKIEFRNGIDDGIYTIWESAYCPENLRSKRIFLAKEPSLPIPKGYAGYFISGSDQFLGTDSTALLPVSLAYLAHGDIVSIRNGKSLRFLVRPSWNHNSILLTERCNHYCLMCSQPPKSTDDSWILDETLELLQYIPSDLQSLGFTGGEPTLYGDGFVNLIEQCKRWLPRTSIHVLSNGRNFSDRSFAQKLAAIKHPDIMLGIPLYSSDPARHDYIVQSEGAFDETVRGIVNLKEQGIQVELRIVLHKQSIPTLCELAEFICRNLLFVDQVALMGLEMIGFTRANLDALWIDPFDYQDELSSAVEIFNAYGIRVMVFNHQLCTVRDSVRKFCVKSISEWKNEYVPECDGCTRLLECGGFFSSGVKYGYSKHIKPFAH